MKKFSALFLSLAMLLSISGASLIASENDKDKVVSLDQKVDENGNPIKSEDSTDEDGGGFVDTVKNIALAPFLAVGFVLGGPAKLISLGAEEGSFRAKFDNNITNIVVWATVVTSIAIAYKKYVDSKEATNKKQFEKELFKALMQIEEEMKAEQAEKDSEEDATDIASPANA